MKEKDGRDLSIEVLNFYTGSVPKAGCMQTERPPAVAVRKPNETVLQSWETKTTAWLTGSTHQNRTTFLFHKWYNEPTFISKTKPDSPSPLRPPGGGGGGGGRKKQIKTGLVIVIYRNQKDVDLISTNEYLSWMLFVFLVQCSRCWRGHLSNSYHYSITLWHRTLYWTRKTLNRKVQSSLNRKAMILEV